MGAEAQSLAPNHTLRPARKDESEQLYAIHRAAMERYVRETWGAWDEEMQRRFWADHWPPERQAIVVDGELGGFLELEERNDCFWVANIELAPRFQRMGIGSAILGEVQRDARVRGLDVALQVLKVNPARALYERLGFEETGQTDTHYLMAWRA